MVLQQIDTKDVVCYGVSFDNLRGFNRWPLEIHDTKDAIYIYSYVVLCIHLFYYVSCGVNFYYLRGFNRWPLIPIVILPILF